MRINLKLTAGQPFEQKACPSCILTTGFIFDPGTASARFSVSMAHYAQKWRLALWNLRSVLGFFRDDARELLQIRNPVVG